MFADNRIVWELPDRPALTIELESLNIARIEVCLKGSYFRAHGSTVRMLMKTRRLAAARTRCATPVGTH